MDGRSTRRRGRRVGGRKKRGTKPPSLRSDKRSLRKRQPCLSCLSNYFEQRPPRVFRSREFDENGFPAIDDRRPIIIIIIHFFSLSLSLSPRRDRTDGSNGFGRERLFVPGKNYATGRDFEGTVFFDALRKNARWGG